MVLGGAQRRLQIQELVNAEECLLGGEEEKKKVEQARCAGYDLSRSSFDYL